jgi:hypothetical protein
MNRGNLSSIMPETERDIENKVEYLAELTKSNLSIWSRVPKRGPIPRLIGRLTVGRKKNSNSSRNRVSQLYHWALTNGLTFDFDHKKQSVPSDITGPPCSWGYKYGDLDLQVGEVSYETVKYGCEFCGTSTQE